MKVSLLTVVALTAAVALCAAADPECVYRKIRALPMHWANPSDCGRFYRCTNKNVKREVICPGEKEYNAKTGKCATGGRGLCKLSFTAPLAAADNICATEVSGAYLPQIGKCRNYYICNDNSAYPQVCPTGSYFDTTSANCVPDTDTSCWQNKCIGVKDATFLPNAPSCQTYLICNKDQAVEQNCAVGSYFNTVTANCNPDVNNDLCWENYCRNVANGVFLKDVSNCNAYYVCFDGKTVMQQCPKGSYFDGKERVCQPGDCPTDEMTTECPIEATTEDSCEGEETTSETPCENEETTTEAPCEDAETTVEEAETESTTTEAPCEGEETTVESPGENEETTTEAPCEDAETTVKVAETESEIQLTLEDLFTCPGGYVDGEFVPHPDNCQLFYICADGLLIETSCQAGNYFEPKVDACLPDSENKCPQFTDINLREKRSINDDEVALLADALETKEEIVANFVEPAVSGNANESCTCPGGYSEGDFQPHPSDCDKYYICYGGQLIEYSCGKGNYFNKVTLACAADTTNSCWPCTGAEPEPANVCLGQANNVMVPNPYQCDAFYFCMNGVGTPKSCFAGEWFDPTIGACEVDVNANCINPCANTTGIKFLPHPDCAKYYFCNNGQTHVENCGVGTAFDSERGICSANVVCAANMCANAPDGTTFPVQNNTSSFYYCLSGVATLMDCKQNYGYNPVVGVCLPQPSTDCVQKTCASGENLKPFVTISGDMSGFCYCKNGGAYKESCQNDYFFNPSIGVCYSNAPCDPEICNDMPEYTVSQNRNDTQSFCLCVTNVPVIVDCPFNGTFYPEAQSCRPAPVADPNCDQNFCLREPPYTTYPALNGITSGFCVCQDLIGTYHSCQGNMQYSQSYGICMAPGLGGPCNVAQCALDPGAVFPAINNPYSFCHCLNETTVQEIPCPNGEKFNTTWSICVQEPCNTQHCLNATNAASGQPFPANNYPYGFCMCDGNVPVLHSCEGGLMFDTTHGVCLPETDEQCNLALCQKASATNQYPTPTISDPNSFCYCFGPTSVQLFNCPVNTLYNADKGICLNPNETPIDDGCTCPGGYKEGQFLAHPTICQKFYICSGGILHETDCGVGNYFNEASDACVAQTTSGFFSASSAATCVGAYHEGDLVPHNTDHRRYYVCYRAQLLERTCGSANVFDAQRLVCVRETTSWSKGVNGGGGRWKQQKQRSAAIADDAEDLRCLVSEKRSVPANCSQYEICVDGRWRRRTCTDQRYYNPEQQKCLEPRDDTICVNAKVSGLPDCNNATEGSMRPGKNISNCAQYFRCTHGKWRLRSCAKQQYYARQLNTCIAASGGNIVSMEGLCDARNYAEGKNSTETVQSCNHTAVRPYVAHCGMYLMCLEAEWWYQYCPLGMYFSSTQNYCMPNNAGQCSEAATSVISAEPNAATIVEFADQNCTVLGALRPSAQACDKYYVCMSGRWHQQSCPPAHYYNVTAEACVRDMDGICAQLTAACVQHKRRAFPLNCTSFKECRDGVWQRDSCPPASAFDDVLQQCVPEQSANCASSGLRRVCRPGEIRPLPLLQNCTEFYNCWADSWHIAECMKGYTYAADLHMCLPHAVDDKCRVANQTQTWPQQNFDAAVEENPEIVSCLGREDSVTLLHSGDCSHFYLCLNEVAIEQECPLSSFYDATLGYCRPNDGSCRPPLIGACANANYDSFVAHPEDCRAYYHCSAINGTQLFYCPEGEYYHNYTRQCRVDHGECTGTGATPEERRCANAEHGARLPHEIYCNIYYACVRGLAIPVECPEQHQFNAVLGRCLYDETQQCQNGELVNGTTPYSCGNLTDGSYLPDRKDCTRYYICSDGVALPQRCIAGAYFDGRQLLCLPDDGSCPLVDEPNNQTVPPDPIVCEGKHGNLMPDPMNCNEFYVCVNSKLRHERCYVDNFFNVSINQCQLRDRVSEDIDDLESVFSNDQLKVVAGKASQCADSPTNFTDYCAQIPAGSSIAEQGDCRFYISCQDDATVPVSQRCRNGESFDSLLGFCRQNDGTCSLENGQRVGECMGRHGQLTRDADNCRGYFVCINGQKIASLCEADEYFNRTQNLCLKDLLMQCNTMAPVKTENINGLSCAGLSESVLYPYTHDRCRSYFQCVKGVPKIHECADGLYFDASTTRCVKEIAECVMPSTQNLPRAPDSKQPTSLKICEQALLDHPYANMVDLCRSYYTCQSDGGVSYTICPNGTLFSADSGDCIDAANVICGIES